MRGVGGLPRLARAGTRRVARPRGGGQAPLTSSEVLEAHLSAKAFWLADLEDHPLTIGVPVGRDGGQGAVSVDVGLKSMAQASMSELVSASPHLKHSLLLAALEKGNDPPLSTADANKRDAELLRETEGVAMAVVIAEDMQQLPVAQAVHPDELALTMPEEQIALLRDPVFQGPESVEITDFVIDGVPGADKRVAVRKALNREKAQARRDFATMGL